MNRILGLFRVEEKRESLTSAGLVRSCNRYTKLTKQPDTYTLSRCPSLVYLLEKIASNLERFKIKSALFAQNKSYFFVTRFPRPENSRFFLFPYVSCSLERRTSEKRVVFVTEFVTKNVISVTIATNHPRKSLIIRYTSFSYTSPWKVHNFLHREIAQTSLN